MWIGRFVSITTYSTPAILLRLVYFDFDIVLIALFCAAIRKNSISLLSFPFLSQVQVFSCEISVVCRLKCSNSCFSSHFYFLVIFVLVMFVLSVLFLVAVISLSLHFFMQSCSRCIDASTLS